MGLNRLKVELDEHSNKWSEDYKKEEKILKSIFKDDALEIQHVGSTAILGLKAKPIIDIAVAVKDLEVVLNHIDELEKIGYNFRGDAGVKGRYFFAKGPEENRTHYLHVEPIDSENWENHILYKKYLTEHPEVVKEYEALKEELAKKYPDERKKYTAGKNEFIEKVLKKARKEYGNK